jgi:lipopolysaccharide biosynthesis glycosyltransferase
VKQREIVPIFFAVDDNYAKYLCVALQSLTDNRSDKYDYKIHVLIEDLSENIKDAILEYERENVKIEFVDVSEKLRAICARLHMRDYYTKATYYRFFVPEMFPEYDKGLYLDCDIAITCDIAKLYRKEMGKRDLVVAVPDEIITDIEVFGRYSEVVLEIPREEYFNAGILVMNLAEMRRINIEKQFASLLGKRTFRVAQDQDYLNVLCYRKSIIIDKKWNKTPMPYSNPRKIPRIAHYKINYKPWKYDDVVYGDLFWSYAEKTRFYGELLEAKNAYTAAEKARDQAQYDALVALAIDEVKEQLAANAAQYSLEYANAGD